MIIKGVAHRGYPKKFPENTLSSFQAALDLGYTHLELDVQLTKDGVPVVFHDWTLERMTDGTGNLRDYTLSELKWLRVAGSEQIPTLEEALCLLKGKVIVDIELKKMGNMYPGLEQIVLDMLASMGMREKSLITSFDHFALEKVRELNDQIDIGLINHSASPALFPYMKKLNCKYVSVHYPYINEKFIELCNENEVILIPYTIDNADDMAKFTRYPELLICTNELERWIRVSTSKE